MKIHDRSYFEYPSLNEIFAGIINEAKFQLKQSSENLTSKGLLYEAQLNIKESWLQILNLIEDTDKNAYLTDQILENPRSSVTQVMLYIFSMECFLQKSLYDAIKYSDESKVDTLGPYAHVMSIIVREAGVNRSDISNHIYLDSHFYRGTSLSENEIQKYRENINMMEIDSDGDNMPAKLSINGYTCCCTDQEFAVQFCKSDPLSGKLATLFDIHWKVGKDLCSQLDNSPFKYEREVLLADGISFRVTSIKKEFKYGKDLVIINLMVEYEDDD